jgi:hypothetical protein
MNISGWYVLCDVWQSAAILEQAWLAFLKLLKQINTTTYSCLRQKLNCFGGKKKIVLKTNEEIGGGGGCEQRRVIG